MPQVKATPKKAPVSQTPKTEYVKCDVEGHYCVWLSAVWFNTDDNGNENITISYRICDGPAAGQFLYDHFRVSTEGGAKFFADVANRLCPGFNVEQYNSWGDAATALQEAVGTDRFILHYTKSEEGYDRIYFVYAVPGRKLN